MVKSGLGLFAGRRKSQGNVIDDAEPKPVPDATPAPETSSGGFRLMSTTEAEARKREEKRRAQEKAANKFRPFSSFGGAHNKGRNHSFDDESPASSKRDSKSSSGTQSSRPYNNAQFGSTSTLPSSADTDSNDNIFAIPRPQPSHHNSSPQSMTLGSTKKELPALPKASTAPHAEPSSSQSFGRVRAMTSSSYASTAKPPTLDADINFGSTSFDDLFSGLDRNETQDAAQEPAGRSLLAGKRTFQAEPIKVDNKLEVEAPLTSWDSHNSNENLISAPRSPDDDSPPPVPPHKYSKYAPVASESPSLHGTDGFDHVNERSAGARASANDSSPERHATSQTSSSAPSLQTPLSSRSGSNTTTPKAIVREEVGSGADEYENIFAPQQKKPAPAPAAKPAPPKDLRPPPSKGGQRIMSQAEFRAQQQRASAERQDSSSDEEDYEDEEEAIERAQKEAIARRKNQKMDLARASMIRSTTAPARPDSIAEPHRPGFPSEVSMQAEEWDDEDIPIGILVQHGFPGHGKPPTQPANAKPSYIPSSSLLPERPASAGAMSNRQSQGFKPVFARNLPEDPYANTSHIGGGLVRPSIRESMGFNRGPASVAGDGVAGVGMPMVYPEPQMSAPSLVDQIHMRDMTKQKYMGGASGKKPAQPAQGPFTGMLAAQMNLQSANAAQTRMSVMGGMPGMPMQNGMMPMGQNMMGAPMGMPMMGMNGMGMNGMAMNGMAMNQGMNGMAYPMAGNDMLQMQQMQQMISMQQAQLAQLQAMTQQGSQTGSNPRMSMVQDPRMSMVQDPRMSMASFGGNFLNVPGGAAPPRPMSVQQQPRPFSTPHGFSQAGGPAPGYTPSIAPSERSNIGLSARYRPVATHQDNKSSISNNTALQVSGGATQGSQTTVKGILKHKTPPVQEEDEAWGNMASRKKKTSAGGSMSKSDPLRELAEGLDRL